MENKDRERYARQIQLSRIGDIGQERLHDSAVLIVGVGGLGSPIALYLAAAGVGRIGLIDADKVSMSNLQRQVLYSESEVGEAKTVAASRRLKALNSTVTIDTYDFMLDDGNASEIIGRYDIVVDGCDNLATRYVIDKHCGAQGKPYVYGAIGIFGGQVSVFHYGENPRAYTELFPKMEDDDTVRPPLGVIGTTPAVIGSFEANEVIKIICGFGNILSGKLLNVELDALRIDIIDF